jgi:peptidyl-dipeptidase Dcp
MQEQLKKSMLSRRTPRNATFDNTVIALERTGRLLDRAQRTFSNLNAADTNPTRQKIETELAPKLSAHHDDHSFEQQTFRAHSGALFQSGKAWARSGIELFAGSVTIRISCVRGAKLSDPDKRS